MRRPTSPVAHTRVSRLTGVFVSHSPGQGTEREIIIRKEETKGIEAWTSTGEARTQAPNPQTVESKSGGTASDFGTADNRTGTESRVGV